MTPPPPPSPGTTPRPIVRLREITPRLTFQAHQAPTSLKIELVQRLVSAGIQDFELSSFVRPDLVPGLADAADVFAAMRAIPDLTLGCCIGNERGLRAAAAAGADSAAFLLSADEDFARANIGRSTADSLAELERLASLAADLGITLSTYVIFAWGGPTGPARGPAELEPLARRLVDIGVVKWILADSFGYAAPPQIREMLETASQYVPLRSVTVQVHDSRGLGIANVLELAALGAGTIDVSLAGSGGHPAMPGQRGGGVCTEDAVQALELAGYDTDTDLSALVDTANWLEKAGVPGLGFVRHVGPVPTTAQTPAALAFSW
ncbi:hydroxymethylglutaryl-CoA lyase [Streptomyces sp. SAI-135]|uniref:pyruvate carboxyltransferase n=1 Tax=unclassified Streptomyces TaxID=2593676 RepID=UPI00247454E6|nr:MULTISPECIES: pyruvate carboxyltransferase [unclassified Streptomyces]MDH6523339.1 hydroxymethylglutaryl-CoA lyase [Streptomyces sp. SAI-090]MDH6613048.1 hydroxymethylglutaryl-CoA lyase [Streptomyces sp. SAI-135]